MNNIRYISSYEIINNVIRDNGYTFEINQSDFIQWIAEAIDLIAVPMAYQPKLASITIENYRGELPCDLHEITQIAGLNTTCKMFPMKYSTDSFHPVYSTKDCNFNTVNDIDYIAPITTDADGNPAFNFNSNGSFSVRKSLYNGGDGVYQDATYTINDDFIFTSFKDTYKVLIAYKAFPVDTYGFPLIPDEIKFKQAVQAFVRQKVDYILWRRNDIAKDVFDYSEREWMWYVGAAQNAGRIPTIDQIESMKDMSLRLIPKINRHAEGFKYLNSQERRIK